MFLVFCQWDNVYQLFPIANQESVLEVKVQTRGLFENFVVIEFEKEFIFIYITHQRADILLFIHFVKLKNIFLGTE